MPVFDKATGQLIIQQVRVKKSREQQEREELATVNGGDESASEKRPKKMQRYEGGERTSYFRDDVTPRHLNADHLAPGDDVEPLRRSWGLLSLPLCPRPCSLSLPRSHRSPSHPSHRPLTRLTVHGRTARRCRRWLCTYLLAYLLTHTAGQHVAAGDGGG